MPSVTSLAGVAQSPYVRAYTFVDDHPKAVPAAQVASSRDRILTDAVGNASKVMTYLHDTFGRDGYDNKGGKLDVVVHVPEPDDMLSGVDVTGARHAPPVIAAHGAPKVGSGIPMNNAYWDTQTRKIYVGDGDGEMFAPLGGSLDILAHETGHAVLNSEVKMQFEGQQGALHESFGDVLGSLVDDRNWQIGEDTFTPGVPGDALRDLSKPQVFTNMSQVKPSDVEPHDLADIPNLVAYRVAEKIGRQEMGQVWYHGFTDRMVDHARFADAAAATIDAARLIYGASSSQVAAVDDAWKSVGVIPGTRLRPA